VKIRFGTLPVLQALPVYVAQEKGLFSNAGVSVEIIPFNTAAEKDIAIITGNIDGYFGDLVTPAVLKGNGRDVFIVATNYDTRFDRRMFGVMAKPGAKYRSLPELAEIPVAVSSNSVVNYVAERLLTSAGVAEDRIPTVETKNIGLRMQMLLSGQVEAAVLPEPLLTAALSKGAVLLADDSGLATSQTVLVFNGQSLRAQPNAVRAFLKAIDEANHIINKDPDAVRPVMVEHVRLPEVLKSTYPVPRFPKLRAPDKEAVQEIVDWLRKREVIRPALTYEQIVDANLIP
jgi:NitT/TauT family transport system substrate-binding protein